MFLARYAMHTYNMLKSWNLDGLFVGYDKRSLAYLVHYPQSMKVERVRCVKFFDSMSTHSEVPLSEEEIAPRPIVTNDVSQGSNMHEGEDTARYPTRSRNKSAYLEEYVVDSVVDNTVTQAVDYCYRMQDIPASYLEAVNSPQATEWKMAMDEEFNSLIENETFILTSVPQNREILGGKWVYTVKSGRNNEETFKARYVANGYSQIPGVDYHETFAPTARMSSVRMLMQHAIQNNMHVHQMDVKTAYLNAPIDCEILLSNLKGMKNGEKMMKNLFVS